MYPVKHFLAAILLAPIIFGIYEMIVYKQTGIRTLYFTFMAFEFVFSLPTYIIYHVLFAQPEKREIRPILIKLILNATAFTFPITIGMTQIPTSFERPRMGSCLSHPC